MFLFPFEGFLAVYANQSQQSNQNKAICWIINGILGAIIVL
jgi:hypothetical protein